MGQDQLIFAPLGDARLASHVTSAAPVFLFSGDRVLWANAQGSAVLGFSRPDSLTSAGPLPALQPLCQQVARLAGALPISGAARLERLRGLGGGVASAMACACSRFTTAAGVRAVLVVGAEPVRMGLPLAERVRRWLEGAGPAAIYLPDGEWIAASPELAVRAPLSFAGGEARDLLQTAVARGRAEGRCGTDLVVLERIGEGTSLVVAVWFAIPSSAEASTGTGPGVPALIAEPAAEPIHAPETADAETFTPPVVEPADPPGETEHNAELEPAGSRAAPPASPIAPSSPAGERRAPLRFVWQIDGARCFTIESKEFAEFAGARTRDLLGRPWAEIASALGLDPEGRLERALGSRDTFSGIRIDWPMADAEPIPIDMSGLPVFDLSRGFAGYRGFGVCRLPAAVERVAAPAESPEIATSPSDESVETGEPRPALSLVPGFRNVLPFRGAGAGLRPALTPIERTAFREIAKALGARFEGDPASTADDRAEGVSASAPALAFELPPQPVFPEFVIPSAFAPGSPAARANADERGRMQMHAPEAVADAAEEARELRAILDTATDGVIVTDPLGAIVSINKSAEALFGFDAHELIGRPLMELFVPESRRSAADYFDGLSRNGVGSVLNDGREVIGQVRQGGLIPLFMTIGRIGEGRKFCAVLRDVTQWKRAEEDLLNSKRLAEKASSAKSEFLAKISHEIRTPLNVILGFSEVMMEERFGPIGNERYRDYLRDIHASGAHIISLVNDLLDLSKIEAGKLELSFTSVNLNELVQQCVALMQPQANRERIIIRTSLAAALPPVVVDARSIRQIMLNLLSNSIKFTGAGGQVIVSTTFTERAEVLLRVRDTGVGMSPEEIEMAMQPFRQVAISSRGSEAGTGLGLPLTKALAEANRATFVIKSTVNSGTLIEITFPATRVLAE